AAGPTAPAERHGPGSPGTTADPSTGARVLRPPAAAERPGGYRPTPSGADDPPRGRPPCVPAPPAGPRGARAPGGPRPTRAARHARRPGCPPSPQSTPYAPGGTDGGEPPGMCATIGLMTHTSALIIG